MADAALLNDSRLYAGNHMLLIDGLMPKAGPAAIVLVTSGRMIYQSTKLSHCSEFIIERMQGIWWRKILERYVDMIGVIHCKFWGVVGTPRSFAVLVSSWAIVAAAAWVDLLSNPSRQMSHMASRR